MRLKKTFLPLCLITSGLVLLVAGSFGQARPVHADTPLFYGFESGTQGFTAPDWLSANAGAPSQSADQHSEGSFSLALPVNFTGGGWDQAGADVVIDNYNSVDLSAYASVSFDVYSPTPNVWADLVFNDPWYQPANQYALNLGWNTVTFDISPTSADFPNSGSYFSSAKEFILRVVGKGAFYSGPVYFDNVRFNPTTHPVVQIIAPQMDDTVRTPPGETYNIQAGIRSAPDRQISQVTFTTPKQSGTLTFDATNNIYTAAWNLWKEGDGVKTLKITATDTTGDSSTTTTTVLVQNSQLKVQISSPTFDQSLKGKTLVSAQIQADPRFPLKRVQLQAGSLTLPMKAPSGQPGSYSVQLQTSALSDGVHTLSVVARDSHFTVSDFVDVLVENHPSPAHFIKASSTAFVDGNKSFRYVGWNEYDLFTRSDTTLAHLQQTPQGAILLKGTQISWQQQIDRQMLEAERYGLNVLRTWAFDNSTSDPFAFQTAPGQYNEAEFQRLDYIMASAQRHHIRVILTLENYWGDYGGIQQDTNWLGLSNKLQFFTDPQAQAYYKQYVAHLVNRVNTMTGVAYKNDPTIFSWELMNEPRIDCNDDPTPTHQYCDPSGATLRSWVSTMSSYIKGLDPKHMVSTGSEGHGFILTGANGQGMQWAGSQEGNGNSPTLIQNVSTIDFVTFHPYPNASWANLTLQQTRQLIQGITHMGLQTGKPVVMEEFGMDRALPVFNEAGVAIQPTDSAYAATRVQWYKDMLETLYKAGAAGSNIWQLADWSDPHYNVNPYLPQSDAERDAALIQVLAQEACKVS